MMKILPIVIVLVILIVGILVLINVGTIKLPEETIDSERSELVEVDHPRLSSLFRVFAYERDIIKSDTKSTALEIQIELKPELMSTYREIGLIEQKQNSIVVIPIFTSSAYWEPGFYTYYRGECNESCLTTKIEFEKPLRYFSASQNAAKVLEVLGYDTITDIEIDKNPKLLSKYNKVILLHNEYVTRNEFNAIRSHPNVIYLYPNALHAEISADYENNNITLLRGHGYPQPEINNGFDWEHDNTHPYEYDTECKSWQFYEIDNGKMLNCYPEHIIISDKELLKAIKDY